MIAIDKHATIFGGSAAVAGYSVVNRAVLLARHNENRIGECPLLAQGGHVSGA